ncbi:putative CdaR family transcriptional regulator [Rhodococcus sp. AW25M09]|uniref:helix-turn-helix domain-containing protein n=1 Tax=Rhodococcus sp. AW25M09 TaxID=1268303 RepID=UPI0002ABE692|nr:PucR family transcriptional regulator [Rhodococcus sp. AW25M09]CCQ15669.1 putative CdaR family transcriptional regulator [Rhodococcus sp. AW25M09]
MLTLCEDQPTTTSEAPETVADLLGSDLLAHARIVAGRAGLTRSVSRVNQIEDPGGMAFYLRPGDLVSTTSETLEHMSEPTVAFVSRLQSIGVAGLLVHVDAESALSPSIRRSADELGLPLLEVTEELDPDHRLTRGIRERAKMHVRAMFRSDRLRRTLTDVALAGGGMEDLATATSLECDVAVSITTVDGREIATAGSAEELQALRGSIALDSTGRLRTDSIDGGLGLHSHQGNSIAVCAISANGTDHGRVVLFSSRRQLTEPDLYAADTAAGVFAVAVARDLALSAVEDKHRSNFLRDLLLGRGGEHAHAVAHARRFGWDIGRPVVVVAIEPIPRHDDPSPTRRPLVDRQMAAFSSALAQRDSSAAIAALGTETVIIMGSGPTTVSDVHEIVERVHGDGGGGRQPFTVGISRPCTAVDDIPATYAQARTAVKVGRRIGGDWTVTAFDELGVFRLLSLVDNEDELELFARETLHDLAGHSAEAQDMRKTLDMLLATNINIAETARALHFHYNTLRYRITKLEKILGPFTDHADLRLDLSLALKIMAMRATDHQM